MKHFEITISVRDAKKAQDLLNDCRGLREFLSQDASNAWSDDYDENIENLTAQEEDLISNGIMTVLENVEYILDEQGIEYETRIWNED